MWWDEGEGAYMVILVVGGGVVELVLDTGSSQLSVKGQGCMWRNCEDGDKCTMTKCPCGTSVPLEACEEHYYQPTGRRLMPGETTGGGMLAGVSTKMKYGSQTDTIEHYLDTVAVPVGSHTGDDVCTALLQPPNVNMFESSPSTRYVGELIVHRVSHIEGTTTSNLLGLARPNGGNAEHGSHVVLDRLFDASGEKVWSMVLYPRGGWLGVGALSCFASSPQLQRIPLIQPDFFKHFLTSFYVVNVHGIEVGRSFSQLTSVKNIPKYCVIDTGTTSTYGSVRLGTSLSRAGYIPHKSVFRLHLGTPNTSILTLDYTAPQLVDASGDTILNVWPGQTLDDYDVIFPNSKGGVLLLGVLMMTNMYWEFDLNTKTIGVSDLRDT